MTHPLASDHHVLCAVCRGQAGAVGYKPARKDPAIWFCNDRRCQALGEKVYAMTKTTLKAYEQKASTVAGDQAGAYLDELAKTDLAELSREEWEEFIARVILGYQDEMRRMIEHYEAPF